MYIIKSVCLSVFLFSFLGCNSSNKAKKNEASIDSMLLWVGHYRVPCTGLGEQFCYLIKTNEDDSWDYLYEGIKGFNDYKWGHEYVLQVVKEELIDPPQDGSSISFVLEEVVSDEKVPPDTEFELALKGNGPSPVAGTAAEGFQLLGRIEVDCQTNELCEELDAMLRDKPIVRGIFMHHEREKTISLIALKNQ